MDCEPGRATTFPGMLLDFQATPGLDATAITYRTVLALHTTQECKVVSLWMEKHSLAAYPDITTINDRIDNY